MFVPGPLDKGIQNKYAGGILLAPTYYPSKWVFADSSGHPLVVLQDIHEPMLDLKRKAARAG